MDGDVSIWEPRFTHKDYEKLREETLARLQRKPVKPLLINRLPPFVRARNNKNKSMKSAFKSQRTPRRV